MTDDNELLPGRVLSTVEPTAQPATEAGRRLLNALHRLHHIAGHEADIVDIEAEAARLAVEELAEPLARLAYADRPPTGPRPVPWPPVARREWTAWARRILAALDEGSGS